MKKNSILRKVLAVSLAAALMAGTGFATAGQFIGTNGISVNAAENLTYGDFEYEVNDDNTVTITGYRKFNIKDVIIPYTIYGKKVTAVGDDAFSFFPNLTSVTLPDSITKIGVHTFYECKNLANINIPDKVNYIGDYTFENCTSLTSIRIPDGVTSINGCVFCNCTSLKEITIPDSVTEIGIGAFGYCTSLTSIKIPNGVYLIDEYAFQNCAGLKKVIIPDKVTSISRSAFEGCTGLKSITLPDDVTYIGYAAFENCTNLASITIPDGVNYIGSRAFFGCDNLTVYGKKGSYVETCVKEYGIPFVAVTFNKSTISANKIVIGQTVTVNAKASEDNCTYAVYYKQKAQSKWTTKQGFSTNDTIVIKPAKATDYDVCVKVKDSTGNIIKKYFEVKVNAKLANTSTISATTIKKGNTVTLNGSATGGMGGYTYAALYKKKAETKWTVRQNYKDNSEILVRPYTNTDYDICIKVKDKDGTIAKKYFTVTVTK